MLQPEVAEAITVDRNFWKDDQRGVNISYRQHEIQIESQFVVAYYDEAAGLYRVIVCAENAEGTSIQLGRWATEEETREWLIATVAPTIMTYLRFPGDMQHPTNAVLALCYAMAGESRRLFDFAKNNPLLKGFQDVVRQELERPIPDLHLTA